MNGLESSNTGLPATPTLPLSPMVIRAIFLLLGVGILIPWNAFVSAKSYFQSRLCQEGNVIVDFELWFGLVWNTSSVCSLGIIIASVAFKDAFCKSSNEETSRRLNSSSEAATDTLSTGSQNSGGTHHSNHSQQEGHSFWLVMVPLALYLMLFAITDLLVLVPSIEPHTFLILTLGGLAICGTCGAIATAGIISTAGLFESHLGITPFFSGQALGGVAVSIASFIAATLEDPTDFWDQACAAPNTNQTTATTVIDVLVRTEVHNRQLEVDLWGSSLTCSPYSQTDWAVFGYFLAGCLVLAACLVGYTIINRFQKQEHRDDYETIHDTPITPILDEPSPRLGLEMKNQRAESEQCTMEPTSAPTTQSYHGEERMPSVSELMSPSSLVVAEGGASDNFSDELSVEPEEYTEEESELAVFSAIKGPATCIFLVFSLTLCLFPSWVSQLRSARECQTHFRLANDLYAPLSFVVFNIGDLTGRVLSEKVPVTHIRHLSTKLVAAALGRLLLFPPLFLLCVNQESRSWHVHSDIYSFVVQFLFAITNGLLVSCSFMHAPHLVAHNTSMQERASEMMTFAVSFGLLTGSLLSFPFASLASNL